MISRTLFGLREQMHNILAQGLRFMSQEELGQMAEDLSALNLTQPATLITQLQQNVADGRVEQTEAEVLIKVLQILSQAEIQLSDANTLDLKKLIPVHRCPAVSMDAGESSQRQPLALHEIIGISNPFVRGHWLVEYFKNAAYEESVTAVEIVWCDYSLTDFIAEGLKERPEEAVKLAKIALNYKKNLVMQRIALKVLEMVGLVTGDKMTVSDILIPFFKKVKEPITYLVKQTSARIDGTYPAYRMAQQKCIYKHTDIIHQLSSRKKSDRCKAIRALAKTKNPCFTDVLLHVLNDSEQQVVDTAIKALVKIGGFAAIPTLAHMLQQDPRVTVFSHKVAEALYAFGDLRGLEYFLKRKLIFPREAYVSLTDFGMLAIPPLFRMLKGAKEPEQYRDGLLALFKLFRSEQFARKMLEYAQQDGQFAEQLMRVLQTVYPKQSKKVLKDAPEKSVAIQILVSTTLGTNPHKLAAHLRHKYLIHNIRVAPDVSHVVTLDANGNVTIWKTEKWKKQTTLSLHTSRQHYYTHQIALTPDGQYLVTTNNLHNTVDILQFGKWENSLVSLQHETEIYSVEVTGDGNYILGGGKDTVKIWEFGTWKEVAELRGHSHGIEMIKSGPGKPWVITGDRNGLMYVWDYRRKHGWLPLSKKGDWKKVADLQVNGIIANSVAVSPDGAFVVAVETLARYLETTVKIWETETWHEIASFAIPSRTPISSLAFTPDGRYLLTGSDEIKFFEVGSWKEVLKLANRDARALAVTPDRKWVIAGMNVWSVDWSQIT